MTIPQAQAAMKQWLLDVNRMACFAIHENIVKRTPIDTGRAKSSWNLAEDEADPDITPALKDVVNISTGAIIELAAKGASPLSADQAEVAARGQQDHITTTAPVIVVSNNLPYILALENGYSSQAPAGMFQVSVTRGEIELAYAEAIAQHPI